MKKTILLALLILMSNQAFAYYYQTLPEGVRLFLYRNVSTSEIVSTFDKGGNKVNMKVDIDASSKELEKLNDPNVNSFLDLYKKYPEAFNALSLGNFKASADANVKVDAYAFGYGFTDKITGFVALPFYRARVNMKFNKTSASTFGQVSEILQSQTGDDYAQSLGNVTQSFYDLDGTLIQSLVVNGYKYKEVGSWQGDGPGDLQFGLMYNFYKDTKKGFQASIGGAAPTGYVDDPDLLQDIGFGDGQWDGYVEFGGDYVLNSYLSFFSWSRYTHQFSSEKELRIPTSADFPLSDSKGKFNEKLGDIFQFGIGTDIVITDWTSVSFQYQYFNQEESSYASQYSDANNYLAMNTGSTRHVLRSDFTLSTITPFLKKKFLLPATIKVMYEKLYEGSNTPNYDLVSLEFKMLF